MKRKKNFLRFAVLLGITLLPFSSCSQSQSNGNVSNEWLQAQQREVNALPLVTLSWSAIPVHEYPTVYSKVIAELPEGTKVRCRNFVINDMIEVFDTKTTRRIGFVYNFYIEHTGKLRKSVEGMRAGSVIKYRCYADGQSFISDGYTFVDDSDIIDHERYWETVAKIGSDVKPKLNLKDLISDVIFDDANPTSLLQKMRHLYSNYKAWLTIDELLDIAGSFELWGNDEDKSIAKEAVAEAIRRDKEYVQLKVNSQGSEVDFYSYDWVEAPFWIPTELRMFYD